MNAAYGPMEAKQQASNPPLRGRGPNDLVKRPVLYLLLDEANNTVERLADGALHLRERLYPVSEPPAPEAEPNAKCPEADQPHHLGDRIRLLTERIESINGLVQDCLSRLQV